MQAHLQTAQAYTQAKVCKRACKANADKNGFKKFSDPSKKNKKRNAQPDKQMTENPTTTMVYRHDEQERQQLTAVWRNGGFSASYDSFVVGSSVVLLIKFCAKNPPLRQAANR